MPPQKRSRPNTRVACENCRRVHATVRRGTILGILDVADRSSVRGIAAVVRKVLWTLVDMCLRNVKQIRDQRRGDPTTKWNSKETDP